MGMLLMGWASTALKWTKLSVALPENAATVIINEIDPRSKLSVQLLSDDLKKLVEEHWDWQVKRINDSDFSVIFPNAQSLKLCKNTGGLTLPVSKVSVLVVEPQVYQDSETSLAKVWVFLSDVRPCSWRLPR
jgi:hypothetical protein